MAISTMSTLPLKLALGSKMEKKYIVDDLKDEVRNLRTEVDKLKKGSTLEKIYLPLALLVVGSIFAGLNHKAQLDATKEIETSKRELSKTELRIKVVSSDEPVRSLKALKILKEVDSDTFNELLNLISESEVPASPTADIQTTPGIDEKSDVEISLVKKSECRPFPGRRDSPSSALALLGTEKANWFPVVASIYLEDRAQRHADRIEEKINGKYDVHVYKAKDSQGAQVWALTLGGYLDQHIATTRVCEAQGGLSIAEDAYLWASNSWGGNLRD